MRHGLALTGSDDKLFDKDAERLMSTASAARYLDVRPQTLRKWISAGRLVPFARLGRHPRFRKRDLDALLVTS